MTRSQRFSKRAFDLACALLGLLLFWWIILLAWFVSTIETGKNGFFIQERVGKDGRRFGLIKIRTMRDDMGVESTVTTAEDPRITFFGRLLRRMKIDELPQLWNVLRGDMSMVGPRPDVPGFADRLTGEDRKILEVRPGITGPATLKYRDEEILLAEQEDPERFNRERIFPDKVRLNREYVENYSFWRDCRYLWWTITRKRLP